jgi:acyl-coenzyme A thioesterase PaaI-like protein
VQPTFFKPGTDRVRLGVLATLVDVVSGSPEHGFLTPTVDLRVTLLDRVPSEGVLQLVCRPAKVGRRLFVGETLLHTGDESRPFARATSTFLNQVFERESPRGWREGELGFDTYDESLLAREVGTGELEMDVHAAVRNQRSGTIQGGAQALLAEVAGDHALGARSAEHEAVDLEIRYLNPARAERVVATGEALPGAPDRTTVRVALTESGPAGRLVSLTSLLFRPVS